METLLIIVGAIFFTAATIWLTRTFKTDGWAWAFALIMLPLFYVGFGWLGDDMNAIRMELLWGIPYFLAGGLILILRGRSATVLLITAFFWLLHAGYDFWHDLLFINPGVFSWYPLFCAVVDFIAFGYLVYLARQKMATT